MGITDRILDGLKTTIQLNDRVVAMSGEVKQLARDVRGLDRRLVRVETALEMATQGRFTLPQIEDGQD
jgi:hypothetical protein